MYTSETSCRYSIRALSTHTRKKMMLLNGLSKKGRMTRFAIICSDDYLNVRAIQDSILMEK